MSYELRPIHDKARSFYGKARVEQQGKVLISYTTKVAEIKNEKPIVHGTYSATTLRHIKEYLKQAGYKAETKKQIEEDYMENQQT